MPPKIYDNTYLINQRVEKIIGRKLPTNKQALGLFLHKHIVLNLSVQKSASVVVKEIMSFWVQAKIPVRQKNKCVDKLYKLFDDWKKLKKNRGRKISNTQKLNEEIFQTTLNNLFDIGSQNALEKITDEHKKLLLISQRQEHRRGFIGNYEEQDIIGKKSPISNNNNNKYL